MLSRPKRPARSFVFSAISKIQMILGLFLLVGGHLSAQRLVTDTVTVAPTDTCINLSRQFIIPSSLKISDVTGREIESHPFILDAVNGNINDWHSLGDTAILVISYAHLALDLTAQILPHPLPRYYVPDESRSAEVPTASHEMPPPSRTEDRYDFLKSGTLYRGIRIGSESGMTLQSGLNLELEGKIAEDISVVGVLSDQNIPLQPEGNTQTLDEIDRVFIRVNMPHENLTFGDYDMSLASGRYGTYSRKLQGVLAESKRRNYTAALAGAVTKGQYHSNYFTGEEGNQGPYQLHGREGIAAIIILAGTEKVWLDGNLLTRGENNDYIIDYSTAEITFMPRRLITSASRITVDFQYSDLTYQKNIWVANNQINLMHNKINLGASVVTETDDKENPIEITISRDEKTRLKALGDAEDQAFQSTVVPDTTGAYILSGEILVYVGKGLGTHSATFYNIGQKGTYKKVYTSEIVYFQYVDKSDPQIPNSEKEQALYLPAKPLKLPRQQRLYHLSGTYTLSPNFSARTEVARSVLDKNLFSPLQDHDNAGTAFNLSTNGVLPLAQFGQITASGNYYQQGQRFVQLDRNQVVEYQRKWDLPTDSTSGEQVYEGQLEYKLKQLFFVRGDGGVYQRGGVESRRQDLSAGLSYKMLETMQVRQESIQRHSRDLPKVDWVRRQARLAVRYKSIRPYFEFNSEKRDGDSSTTGNFRFVDQRIGISSAETGVVNYKIESQVRVDDQKNGVTWNRQARAQNILLSGQLNQWRNLSALCDYTWRRKHSYGQNNLPDIEFHLLNLQLRWEPYSRPFSWEMNHRIEEEQSIKKEWRYIYAGKGQGQYLYDSTYADYIPHPQGDYLLRIIPSAIREPVTSFNNSLRVYFNGAALKKKHGKLLNRFATISEVRLQQQIKSGENPLRYWRFNPAQIDTQWQYFQRIIQQDVIYRPALPRSELRLRFNSMHQITGLDVRGAERNISTEWNLRYRRPLGTNLDYETEWTTKTINRESVFNSLRDRNISSQRFKNVLSYTYERVHRLSLDFLFMQDKESEERLVSAWLTTLKPVYEYKISGKGRVKVFMEFNQVSVTPKRTLIPWEMCNGKKEGVTFGWGSALEYYLAQNLSLRLNYESWKEPQRDIYHLGSGEMRIFF